MIVLWIPRRAVRGELRTVEIEDYCTRALDRRVQHARGRARGTRVTHAHRKHGR